jgi:hypothetical protein
MHVSFCQQAFHQLATFIWTPRKGFKSAEGLASSRLNITLRGRAGFRQLIAFDGSRSKSHHRPVSTTSEDLFTWLSSYRLITFYTQGAALGQS